jgi:competence CoiA-like predicted nuclease
MPHIAVDVAQNRKVISFDYESTAQLKQEFPRGFRCTCGRTMHPRGGENRGKVLHFAHNPHSGGGEPPECSVENKYKGMARGELLLHTLGQSTVYRYLKNYCIDADETVEIEVPIGNRRADVCIKTSDGIPTVAHEIQLSRQTITQLEQRTADYEANGVDVVWWFGGNCDTPETQSWAKQNFPFHHRVIIGEAINLATLSKYETVIHTEKNDSYHIDEVCDRSNADGL